jgi:uncharacterized protein YbaR (Trm112 family)
MSLDPRLLALLCDPLDHGPLRYVSEESVLVNPRTAVAYPVANDIVSLVPGEGQALSAEELERLLALDGIDTATA